MSGGSKHITKGKTSLPPCNVCRYFNQLPIKLAHILGHLARRFRLWGAVEASALPVFRLDF